MIDRENEITERQCGRDVESRKKKCFFFFSLQLFSFGEIVPTVKNRSLVLLKMVVPENGAAVLIRFRRLSCYILF